MLRFMHVIPGVISGMNDRVISHLAGLRLPMALAQVATGQSCSGRALAQLQSSTLNQEALG